VNLFHFTHPRWLAARGGLADPANHADFLRYVERVGRALVPHARWFHVANESMVYVLSAYLLGEMPPFVKNGELAMTMTRHVLSLHADAYRILKSLEPVPNVATIEVCLDPHPVDPADPKQRDAAQGFDRWYHGTLLEGLATGVVRVPGREPEEIPHLRGALDAYGFNYYSAIAFGERGPSSYSEQSDGPVDAMGRFVHPRGLEDGLVRVAAALPGVPLYVTENGCPTQDERFRIRYMAAHLGALARARARGLDVRGYFHWTAVDNYEWAHGFGEARFGLIGFDPDTGERHLKESARWLARVIEQGGFAPGDVP
jgi:beta-glucosidase